MSINKDFTPLDQTDKQVIEDAVRLLKSQFIDLYVEMGYNREKVGSAWHKIRTSKSGHELLCELYKKSKHVQALTFISDIKEEVSIRKKKVKKNKK